MSLYRKKPVVIEARRMEKPFKPLAAWCGGTIITAGDGTSRVVGMVIHTLEGDHLAHLGDFIIKGVKGEFYPCKPDIFEQTYEPVGEE
jgi:hypothetical protein